MVAVITTVKIFEPRYSIFVSGANRGMQRTGRQLGRKIERTAARLAPKDEGHLAQSLSFEVTATRSSTVVRVTAGVRYGIFVARGTGIYGPLRRPIVAAPGKVFAFRPKEHGPLRKGQRRPRRGARTLVFATKIRGTPSNDFMVAALKAHVPAASVGR